MNRQHPRVLVVEDEPTVCHVLAKLFEAWHWEAVKAHNVAEGLTALDALRFDLLIVDLCLPDGSGIEVLRKLRADQLKTEVVVSTARGIEAVADLLPLKPDQVLFKPFVFEPLKSLATRIYASFRPATRPPE